jgi:type IV pilus assembly protein PilO
VKKIPIWAVLLVAVVIVAVVGYVLGVRPKQADASKLSDEVAALNVELDAAQKLIVEEGQTPETRIRVADVVELAKAMPDVEDMAGIVFELNSQAESAGVKFSSIQPGLPLASGGYAVIPISLTFEGNYYDLTELLFSLRNLVVVREGVLEADGRLFKVDAIDLQEGTTGFPQVKGLLTVSAYQYGDLGGVVGASGTTAAASETTTTTGTSTTGTTTTETTTTETTPGTTTAPPPEEGGAQAEGGTP